MSTILNSFTRPSALRVAAPHPTLHTKPSGAGVRGLSVMLLAAAVSTLVLIAERIGSTWTDGDLFMGWMLMWVVVLASLALLAGTARSLAGRVIKVLDGWSSAMARSRADARTWNIAQSDPRVMADLMQACERAERVDAGFDAALAPMGLDPAPVVVEPSLGALARFSERLAASRSNHLHLHYI